MPAGIEKATIKSEKSDIQHAIEDGSMALTIDQELPGKWLDIAFKYKTILLAVGP